MRFCGRRRQAFRRTKKKSTGASCPSVASSFVEKVKVKPTADEAVNKEVFQLLKKGWHSCPVYGLGVLDLGDLLPLEDQGLHLGREGVPIGFCGKRGGRVNRSVVCRCDDDVVRRRSESRWCGRLSGRQRRLASI